MARLLERQAGLIERLGALTVDGDAVRLLRGALTLLAARGVSTALLTCDETNTASVATIRACGGVLRDRVIARS